jgi:arylsulfatase A-like enzyme
LRKAWICILPLVFACGTDEPVAEFEGLVDLRQGPPNVVILALDTWRADHMGVYGNEEVRTPALDAFAREAIVFEDCASTSTWTLPSFASMFTGLYPSEHRTVGGEKRSILPSKVIPLAERLQVSGYTTSAFVAVDYLCKPFGLQRGFDSHRDYSGWPVNGRVRKYERVLRKEIRSPSENPRLLLVHYFDAHDPYEPPDEFDRMYYRGDPFAEPEDPSRAIDVIYSEQNRINQDPKKRYRWLEGVKDMEFPVKQYAGGITYLDHHVGAALDTLRATGLMDESIVIVVADHGEHLTEHDVYFTHRLPYAECLQVPLMIRLPGARGAGMRVSTPVSLVDFVPTVMDLIGMPVEDAMSGTSLTPLMRGEEIEPRLLFAEYGATAENWAKSVWDANWRYTEMMLGGLFTAELFDRSADPGESRDVAGERSDLVELYAAALDLRFGEERRLIQDQDAVPNPVVLDPEVEERLRALGYVDGGGN